MIVHDTAAMLEFVDEQPHARAQPLGDRPERQARRLGAVVVPAVKARELPDGWHPDRKRVSPAISLLSSHVTGTQTSFASPCAALTQVSSTSPTGRGSAGRPR
jgi:hypothetical protein